MAENKLTQQEKKQLYELVIPIAKRERNKIISNYEIIDNTFQILEQLGFFILRFPSKNNNISGFHIEKSGINCIYINSAHTLGRQYFSAWHEYYHAVTGEGGSLSFQNKRESDNIEYKAECFAGCILMPENLVKSFLAQNNILNLKYISYKQIIKMQNHFKVSYSAVITRLIQIHPDMKEHLAKRYYLSNPSRSGDLLNKTIEYNGNVELIKPTNNIYVSQVFFKDIKDNLSSGRVSGDKVNSLIKLLEELEKND